MIPKYNYLIVSAMGPNRPEMITDLSRACVQCGCNLLNTKINVLGQEVVMVLLLAGSWGAIAKMEATLPNLEQRLGLNIQTRRTHEPSVSSQLMSYTIQVVAIDRKGILNEIANFLMKHSVAIEEISAHTYMAHTGTRMASLQLKMNVPHDVHLATLRDKFMSYCDDHNLDGFIEPIRAASL